MSKAIASLMAFSIILSPMGCAVIFTGSSQMIQVSSTPSGAAVRLNGIGVGTTPTQVNVERGSNHFVRLTKAGFEPITIHIGQKLNGLFFLDIISLNLLGIIINMATGAWKWATPEFINVTLPPKK